MCMRIQRKFTEGTSYVLNNEVKFRKAIECFGIVGFQKVNGCAIEGNDLKHGPPIIDAPECRGSFRDSLVI